MVGATYAATCLIPAAANTRAVNVCEAPMVSPSGDIDSMIGAANVEEPEAFCGAGSAPSTGTARSG